MNSSKAAYSMDSLRGGTLQNPSADRRHGFGRHLGCAKQTLSSVACGCARVKERDVRVLQAEPGNFHVLAAKALIGIQGHNSARCIVAAAEQAARDHIHQFLEVLRSRSIVTRME